MKLDKDNRCNIDTLVKASCFFILVFTFQFFSCLVLSRNVLEVTLTQLLESKRTDICNDLHSTKSLKALVITKREEFDEFHSKW